VEQTLKKAMADRLRSLPKDARVLALPFIPTQRLRANPSMIDPNICYSAPAPIAAYAPSLDVYGSYFPAWLICLVVGVMLTILASLLGRVFDLSALRKFGPLVPLSLILIFSITTWFLFFAS
jgi:hypothetical protein